MLLARLWTTVMESLYLSLHLKGGKPLTSSCLPTNSAIVFPSSQGEFVLGRAYTGERLVVPLPEGVTACDIGTLTIWCQPFRVTFSRVTIPRSIFVRAKIVATLIFISSIHPLSLTIY